MTRLHDKWTDAEDDYLIRHAAQSHAVIARHLGRTANTVRYRCYYLRKHMGVAVLKKPPGIAPDPEHGNRDKSGLAGGDRWTEEEIEYVLEHRDDMAYKDIGVDLGRTDRSVRRKVSQLRKLGMDIPVKCTIRTGPRVGPEPTSQVERLVIRDGYDDVPYWMRQAYRSQTVMTHLRF